MGNTVGLLQHASEQIGQTIGILRDQKEEHQYNQYSQMLSSVESMEDVGIPEGANAKVWNKALTDRMSVQLGQGTLKDQRMNLIKGELSAKREMIMENARRAESMVPSSAEAALDTYMQSFSAHPNGIDAKKNQETGMWDFEDTLTGKKWSDNVTLDDARQMTQAMMAPGEYEKMYLTDRSRIINFNKIAMINPDLMESASGEQVSIFTLIDPNTGTKALKILGPDGKLTDLDPEELLHGGYKMVKDSRETRLADMGVKSAENELARQEQVMRHADENMGLQRREVEHKLKGDPPGTGTARKLTPKEEIMSAYGVDEATAMDIIRSDRTLSSRLSIAKAEIKDALLDPQDPKDMKKIEAILKRYNVDQLPGHEGLGRGGQPTSATRAPEEAPVGAGNATQEAEVTKLKEVFANAPDGARKRHQSTGNLYIKKNGQWQLVRGE